MIGYQIECTFALAWVRFGRRRQFLAFKIWEPRPRVGLFYCRTLANGSRVGWMLTKNKRESICQ